MLIEKTSRFSCYVTPDDDSLLVICQLNCGYSKTIMTRLLQNKSKFRVTLLHEACHAEYFSSPLYSKRQKVVQLSDFENIQWENVLAGYGRASSFIVRSASCPSLFPFTIALNFKPFDRKGLSRKAQLRWRKRIISLLSFIDFYLILKFHAYSMQIRRHCSKHPNSTLKAAIPYTIILDGEIVHWPCYEPYLNNTQVISLECLRVYAH